TTSNSILRRSPRLSGLAQHQQSLQARPEITLHRSQRITKRVQQANAHNTIRKSLNKSITAKTKK
ncbi:hypothetical protein MKX03_022397, partial [Papaver bracteatum]